MSKENEHNTRAMDYEVAFDAACAAKTALLENVMPGDSDEDYDIEDHLSYRIHSKLALDRAEGRALAVQLTATEL